MSGKLSAFSSDLHKRFTMLGSVRVTEKLTHANIDTIFEKTRATTDAGE